MPGTARTIAPPARVLPEAQRRADAVVVRGEPGEARARGLCACPPPRGPRSRWPVVWGEGCAVRWRIMLLVAPRQGGAESTPRQWASNAQCEGFSHAVVPCDSAQGRTRCRTLSPCGERFPLEIRDADTYTRWWSSSFIFPEEDPLRKSCDTQDRGGRKRPHKPAATTTGRLHTTRRAPHGLYTYAHKSGAAGGKVIPGPRDRTARRSPPTARPTRSRCARA